jgi:asparagine synthase (glutamine-hydrolysing)
MSGLLAAWRSQGPPLRSESEDQRLWQQMLMDLEVLGREGQGDWQDSDLALRLGRTQWFNTPESQEETPVVEAEGCVLVWSGRLDDRAKLLGPQDRSGNVTDAQLLIEAYRRWGIDCVRHLVGTYGFVLWDRVQQQLVIGTDSTGTHPLAYFWDGQTCLVASRVVTLLAHPQVHSGGEFEWDELYLANSLAGLQNHVPGSTPFANVRRLVPGHVLVVRSGRLTAHQVTAFAYADREDSGRSLTSYIEEFWSFLDQAVEDRLRTCKPVGLTLSGGLDSTAVAVSLLKKRPELAAFSMVTERYPEFDERQPIASFLKYYPQIQWTGVETDKAWALSEPWDELPLIDDSQISCTTGMNLQLMKRMQSQGIGMVFDGEGGDELFIWDWPDLWRGQHWSALAQYLKKLPFKHSFAWRSFVVPRLSKSLQTQWFARCEQKEKPLPDWITPEGCQRPAMRLAIDRYYADDIHHKGLREVWNWGLGSASPVSRNQVFRLLRAHTGLEALSPLQDQRLIDFALRLPVQHQYDPKQGKIFLRKALEGKVPSDIQWRPKTNYFDPMKYAGIGEGPQALSHAQSLNRWPELSPYLDNKGLEIALAHYREIYQSQYQPGTPCLNSLANHLLDLLNYGSWRRNLSQAQISR